MWFRCGFALLALWFRCGFALLFSGFAVVSLCSLHTYLRDESEQISHRRYLKNILSARKCVPSSENVNLLQSNFTLIKTLLPPHVIQTQFYLLYNALPTLHSLDACRPKGTPAAPVEDQ